MAKKDYSENADVFSELMGDMETRVEQKLNQRPKRRMPFQYREFSLADLVDPNDPSMVGGKK